MFGDKITVIKTEDVYDLGYEDKCNIRGKDRRKGFWIHSSKRFFVLQQCMEKHNLTNVIHLENDVLLYNDLSHITFGNYVYLTMDKHSRCVPGFVFFPDHTFVKHLITNYNYNQNDRKGLHYKVPKTPLSSHGSPLAGAAAAP